MRPLRVRGIANLNGDVPRRKPKLLGNYLRQHVRCAETPSGLKVLFDQRQGSWTPWWKGLAVYVHGWSTATPPLASAAGAVLSTSVERAQSAAVIELPDMASGLVEISLKE